jgi:Asp-tRNA(Asn)/Glu-tRNA(Gln) amidotransferase A subunit family amidase
MPYSRTPLSAPVLSGLPLKLFTRLVGTPIASPIRSQSFAQLGVDRLRETPAPEGTGVDSPWLPGDYSQQEQPGALALAGLAVEAPAPAAEGFAFRTVADYGQAYREGSTSPSEVAERVIAAKESSDEGERPLGAFIAMEARDLRAQAEASAARWAEGKPLSVFDGVPVPVKDEVWMKGYPTTGGTTFLGGEPASVDSTVVGRLRAAGALLVGKANMHEFGLGVTGINPHYGPARNPYDLGRITGGSSSGTASAVGAGFGPVGIGADGGGSIRIPAGLCGMVGLKPTYGRVSEHGALEICWSVAHLGPIGATAADVAACYAVIAGEDSQDRNTLCRPAVNLLDYSKDDLSGVRIGIHTPWFEDAEPDVVAGCRALVDQLCAAGAELCEVDVPDIELAKAAHLVIIITEMITAAQRYHGEHRRDFGCDVQINFALGRALSGLDYAHALRHRQGLTAQFLQRLQDVDVLVTPTTGRTAAPIPESALPNGESNLPILECISRFAAVGNLTGLPAIAVPAGYDRDGLPVSCQFMGRPWEEGLLLRIARAAEAGSARRQPAVYYDLLKG